VIEEEIMTQK